MIYKFLSAIGAAAVLVWLVFAFREDMHLVAPHDLEKPGGSPGSTEPAKTVTGSPENIPLIPGERNRDSGSTKQDFADFNSSGDEAVFKSQVQNAMQAYTDISQYPLYSQPIINEAHVASFVNLSPSATEREFPIDEFDQPIHLALSLSKYNYYYGDSIKALLVLQNLPEGAGFSGQFQLLDSSGALVQEIASPVVEDSTVRRALSITVETLDFSSRQWPLEMNMAASVEVDGHDLFISAPFRVNPDTAILESLGFSQPDREFLKIPVNLSVVHAGYYFVSAVLASQSTGKPLVYLETEGNLGEGLATLSLRAHVHALKKGGDEGPYRLTHVVVERWSDDTIPHDVSGRVPQQSYPVEGYSFDSFQDTPYIDPLQQERLQLMLGISGL